MTVQGRPPDTSNTENILAKFPRGTFLLGNYPELVVNEVVLNKKELLVNLMLGVLKTEIESMKRNALPQVHISLP